MKETVSGGEGREVKDLEDVSTWPSLATMEEEYRREELLGSGKFGQVHRVIHRASGAQFAAKTVVCRRASERRRVGEEVALLRELHHPGLLRLHAAYQDTDTVVQVVELLTGGELYERIVDCVDQELSERDIAGFVGQILAAVGHLHARNIVHLDIKPENILCVDRPGFRLKLVDFGLARRLADRRTCVMQGTPDFVSPEVINYEPISTASDMWSVGVVTYVLLTGLSPFLGDSNLETYTNITNLNYTFDEAEFEAVSTSGKEFISSLLQLEPCERLTATSALLHPWQRQEAAHLHDQCGAWGEGGQARRHTAEERCRLGEEEARRRFRLSMVVRGACWPLASLGRLLAILGPRADSEGAAKAKLRWGRSSAVIRACSRLRGKLEV